MFVFRLSGSTILYWGFTIAGNVKKIELSSVFVFNWRIDMWFEYDVKIIRIRNYMCTGNQWIFKTPCAVQS